MDRAPVRAGIRTDTQNPGHTRLSVFVGRIEGSRGHAGVLTLRTDEMRELGHVNADGKWVIEFDMMRPLKQVVREP